MPYEYRHMTPEERAVVVEERRQRGYPLHSPPHPYREADRYCITAANYEHAHIMVSPVRLTAFEDQLLSALADIQAEIGGWVILTNHYNAVKHRYVESSYDWPWSSVHLYFDTYGQQWLRERWAKYPIGDAWDYGD